MRFSHDAEPLRIIKLGDMHVHFPSESSSGKVGLGLWPAELSGLVVPRRATLRGEPFIDVIPGDDPWPACRVDSLVQVKIAGEEYTGAFAQGHTMREAPGLAAFRFAGQSTVSAPGGLQTVITRLLRADGCELQHRLTQVAGGAALRSDTCFINGSALPVTLEMLSSFSLGGITPFAADDAPERLRVHRFRSGWSAEGRAETLSIEALHLERSWSGAAAFSERFGQVGTMPVRKWFPFVAVEDTSAGVVWAAQLGWAGSWQMELFRQHDELCLSGGLADREFGHWTRTVQPGESLEAPPAWITCVKGDLDDACDRLTAVQVAAADAQPASERELPIIFNEWCTTWGDPAHDKLVAIADRLMSSDVTTLVIDAGWYKQPGTDWGRGHGDWTPSADLFPGGLAATAAAIRSRGLVPGLWFEMETVGSQSAAFACPERLLQRDGVPVTVRDRRFWNLQHPEAWALLEKNVIDRLESCGFGYLKVDYNETLGLGSEHPDGLGEGLRQQVLGVHRFFDRIRERLPGLVIENCSSGGHRLEPSMLARTAMSSFSDAHELVEIPLIAANLHRLMLPRQSQIWAVLHASDSHTRLVYSLAATFLGRMCLSGEVAQLSDEQWAVCLQAQRVYRRVAPIIRDGVSRRQGTWSASWRKLRGWQAVVRTARAADEVLVVVHAFGDCTEPLTVDLPKGPWAIGAFFGVGESVLVGDALRWTGVVAFSACVIHLQRVPGSDPVPTS